MALNQLPESKKWLMLQQQKVMIIKLFIIYYKVKIFNNIYIFYIIIYNIYIIINM